jgi:uncharacterized Zn-finger protein
MPRSWALSRFFRTRYTSRQGDRFREEVKMAATAVPHLCNDVGVEQIAIGARELNCMGASPPFDHPHVYLDMGSDTQIICPYCSTLYVYRSELRADESDPRGCLYRAKEKAV